MIWTELNLYINEEFNLYLYNFIAQTKLQKTGFFEPNAVTRLSQLFLVICLLFPFPIFRAASSITTNLSSLLNNTSLV